MLAQPAAAVTAGSAAAIDPRHGRALSRFWQGSEQAGMVLAADKTSSWQ